MSPRELHHEPAAFEQLEQRSLLAVTGFASVGLAYETGPYEEIYTTIFATEGTLDTFTGEAIGTTYGGGNFDRFNAGPLVYGFIDQLDDGRYLRNPDEGTQGDPIESNGARFLTRDGFNAGWWFADFGGGEEEVEWIVERPTDAIRDDFTGTWRFASISNFDGNDDFSNAFGELVISSNTVRWFVDGGHHPNTESSILSSNASGLMRTNLGEYFYLSADGSIMIFADMAEGDDEISIGIAVREHPAPFAGDIVGEYLLSWAFADGIADFGFNGEVDYAQQYLRLEDDGDFLIWDLDDFDSGNQGDEHAFSGGEWFLNGGEVVLEDFHDGVLTRFIVADNASNLIGYLLQDEVVDDPVLGLATRAYPDGFSPVEPGGVFTVPGEGAGGRPLVYELGTDDVWEVIDLIAESGGPIIDTLIATWIDPKDGRAYAAGTSDDGVILYTEPDAGDWTWRNLSDEAFGEGMAEGVQVMISPDGVVHLTGLNGFGELVRYYQRPDLAGPPEGGYRWAFTNIEDTDLQQQGLQTPEFVGALTSYATSWGGLNVAGLDANGRIWSVWWAPGRSRWTITDLTAASGAAPIVGNLAVYLTPWDGINLAGLDTSGDLRVTWWVPGFGGDWAQSNLTTETNGPTFVVGSVTSYVSDWGGLNIAGIDADTGEVKVYWWVPERTNIGWAITSISASLPVGSPRITFEDIRGVAGPDGSLNIFGYGEDGSYLNYYWYPTFGADWRVENLSETAVDR